MLQIQPFYAIMPYKAFNNQYKLHHNFLLLKDQITTATNPNFKGNEGIKHITNMLKQGYLQSYPQNYLYCCKITTPDLHTTGLIALVKINEVGKSIFGHERNIEHKRESYISYFQEHKIQTTPVILAHKNIKSLRSYLSNITTNESTLFTIQEKQEKYEIWKVENTEYCQRLYKSSNISALLIADGHHRIAALQKLNPDGYVMAFLVPNSDLKTTRILRKYTKVVSKAKAKLFEALKVSHNIRKLQNHESEMHANKIHITIGKDLYLIEDSDTPSVIIRVLEELDQHINYIKGELNFFNYHYDSDTAFTQHKNALSVHIPAYEINNIYNVENITYPPHSTLFCPKLPEGLVSFMLQ